MTDEAWNADFVRSLGMLLSGSAIEETNERGELIIGDTLLMLLNAHDDEVPFTLPPLDPDQHWQRVVRHVRAERAGTAVRSRRGATGCAGSSVAVFKVTPPLRDAPAER